VNACELGLVWFGDGRVPNRIHISGRTASLDDALDTTARMLKQAARPLVYLAPDISCEAQREAIALADLLQAMVDSVTSSTAMDTLLAAQEVGRASATLGEVRNRAGPSPMQRW
jgi:formylmethanofuran dehydrogenase subunit B